MSEIRLMAMSAWRVQTIAETMGDDEGLLGAIWDAGITEDEAFYLIQPPPHGEESHQLWTSGRDKLRAAFDQPVPEDSPDA